VVLTTQVPPVAVGSHENAPVGAAEQATNEGLVAVPAAAQFVVVLKVLVVRVVVVREVTVGVVVSDSVTVPAELVQSNRPLAAAPGLTRK